MATLRSIEVDMSQLILSGNYFTKNTRIQFRLTASHGDRELHEVRTTSMLLLRRNCFLLLSHVLKNCPEWAHERCPQTWFDGEGEPLRASCPWRAYKPTSLVSIPYPEELRSLTWSEKKAMIGAYIDDLSKQLERKPVSNSLLQKWLSLRSHVHCFKEGTFSVL